MRGLRLSSCRHASTVLQNMIVWVWGSGMCSCMPLSNLPVDGAVDLWIKVIHARFRCTRHHGISAQRWCGTVAVALWHCGTKVHPGGAAVAASLSLTAGAPCPASPADCTVPYAASMEAGAAAIRNVSAEVGVAVPIILINVSPAGGRPALMPRCSLQ